MLVKGVLDGIAPWGTMAPADLDESRIYTVPAREGFGTALVSWSVGYQQCIPRFMHAAGPLLGYAAIW